MASGKPYCLGEVADQVDEATLAEHAAKLIAPTAVSAWLQPGRHDRSHTVLGGDVVKFLTLDNFLGFDEFV